MKTFLKLGKGGYEKADFTAYSLKKSWTYNLGKTFAYAQCLVIQFKMLQPVVFWDERQILLARDSVTVVKQFSLHQTTNVYSNSTDS